MLDLKTKLPMSESDIVSKVQGEYQESKTFTDAKRDIFKRRKNAYAIKDQENKIYVRYVYATIDTLTALETSDERSVVFSGNRVGMDDYANNINNKAKRDFKEMGCFKKKYQVRHDKYTYGVGIEVFDNWDHTTQNPTYKVISPMVWLPDWFGDVNSGPRYHGFEFQDTRYNLEQDKRYFNTKNMMTTEQIGTLTQQDGDNRRSERGLGTITHSGNDIIDLYYHYTIIAGKIYLAVLSNDKSLLVRFEEIPAMTDIEKEDPTKIQFPVIVRGWRPLRDDPFNICVGDLLEDKESMQQLFINLAKIKAEHEALGDMFLFDPDKVDVNSISIPTIGPKYIPVTGLGAQQYPVMSEIPRGTIKQDTSYVEGEIKNQGMLAMGMDNQTMGIQGDSNITATENQRVQSNANLRLLLGVKFDNEAEKEFWNRWYKFNLYFFDEAKEVLFKLNDSIGQIFYSVKKKDFKGMYDIDVDIISASDEDAKKEKYKIGFMAVSQALLSDPTLDEGSRNFILQEMARVNGVPEEKIRMMVKTPVEYLKAVDDLEFLNRNEDIGEIKDMNENHWIYLNVYDRAFDTDAKYEAINKRMMALQMSGQTQPQQMLSQQGQQPGMGAMGGMVVNDMLQQSNKKQNGAQSLSNISQ